MPQKVSTPVEAEVVTISPLARVIRTLLQVTVAIGAAIPLILNSGAITTPKTLAVLSTALVVVTTLQNFLEHIGILPVVGGKLPPPLGGTATPTSGA